MEETPKTEEVKEVKVSKWADPEKRKIQSEKLKAYWADPAHKAEQSARLKKAFADKKAAVVVAPVADQPAQPEVK
jgi:hypothetical protein